MPRALLLSDRSALSLYILDCFSSRRYGVKRICRAECSLTHDPPVRFGQPISRFQGVSFPLAEHATYLEAGRWLCYRALGLREAGHSCNTEAAMVKWWVPKLAFDAINDCIVLHGQVGWSDEIPLQQMLRDVSGLQIGDGTPQIQKLVIARQLFGRDFV